VSEAANHHASAVAFGPFGGVLILGPSGAGKSRLALRLIEAGAQLIADDQVFLTACDGALYARAPGSIAGKLEMRGLGIISLPFRRLARLALAVDLGEPVPDRLPHPRQRVVATVSLPCISGQTDPAFPAAVAHYMRQARRTE
jgi:HPr kinase/phosphorylase